MAFSNSARILAVRVFCSVPCRSDGVTPAAPPPGAGATLAAVAATAAATGLARGCR